MAISAQLTRAKERTEATVIERDPENRSDSPDYESQSYRDQLSDVELVRAVHEGTGALRKGGEDYLPKHPMEGRKQYDTRVKIALSYNATKRTADGLVGMLFRREPVVSDAPPDIEDDLEDVDLQGRALGVFLRQVAENALLDGHTWLHIEEPKVDQERVRTARMATEAGVRPYWLNITKKQAHNWRFEVRDGRPVLTLFAYRESHAEPDGAFGEVVRQRVRVLREAEVGEDGVRSDVRGELWEFRKADGTDRKDRWVQIDAYNVGVKEIPVVCVYGNRTGTFTSRPPLLDLAYEQVEHYRVRSERQKAMTYAAIAVPYAFGRDMTDEEGNATVQWGSDGMMLSNDPEATAGIIESRGYGLDALKEELQEIQARMASLGLQLIARANQAQSAASRQTATENVLSKSEGDAWLQAFATALQDAVNEALLIHGQYRNVESPGTVEVNHDFHDQLIDAGVMKELREFHEAEIIPIEDVWAALQRGEILDETFDFDDARRRLALAREERLSGIGAAMFGANGEGGGEGGTEDEEVAA